MPVETGGQRKTATMLCTDLAGYTALSSERDPEHVYGLVRPFLTRLRGIAERHGGQVPHIHGDGFVALFTADGTGADPAPALLTAVALQAEASQSRLPVEGLYVGLATGEVFIVDHADEGLSITGPAADRAPALCALARPGESLADDRTRDSAAADVGWGPSRVEELVGFPGPLTVHPLIGIGTPAAR